MAVAGQIDALGQVLTHQGVDVFVGTTLPGAVPVAEVHGDTGFLSQLLVQRHLPALVVHHAQAHGLSDAQQLVAEGLQHGGGAGLAACAPRARALRSNGSEPGWVKLG